MKTIMTTLLLLFIVFSSNAQFDGKTVETRFGLFISPGSIKDDGFSIGATFNANFDWGGYISPEIYYFPDLRGMDYFHIGSEIGYNVFFNENFRMYSGIFLGLVLRNNNGISSNGEDFEKIEPNGTFGVQAGIQYQIGKSPFILGLKARYQYRTDTRPRDPNYWRFNNFAEVLIILN